MIGFVDVLYALVIAGLLIAVAVTTIVVGSALRLWWFRRRGE